MGYKISMVAGEPSGDLLASRVMQGLIARDANLQFNGIGGPYMQASGLQLNYPMDALSVFGYIDALKQLPRLISIYSGFKKQTIANKPDVFVGVDAPDFNLRLEEQLKKVNAQSTPVKGKGKKGKVEENPFDSLELDDCVVLCKESNFPEEEWKDLEIEAMHKYL